ncbi:hypothetical protein [Mucilaginibacter lacusdianchii]|uniref:hypothetical protein n=1 Tax=Mucilaginibacter lacusdianchii TaxID=2684211 RepID=UPI00131DC051|nr:hypothetical protein [Mucilaginibacter sp. JXJ CY 39]
MKRFLLRLLIFVIPVALFIIVGEALLYRYKETVPINTVMQKQLSGKDEIYFGRTLFNNPETPLKMAMMKVKKPDIITLGISVVLQYRDFYFHPYESRFYNGGFMLRNVYDLHTYVSMIRKNVVHKPKLIIFGFDPSWIKKSYVFDTKNNITNPDKDGVNNLNNHIGAIQSIWHQVIINDLNDSSCLYKGYGKAGMQGNGYRRDGSMHNWNQIKNYLSNKHYSDVYGYKKHLQANTLMYNKPMKVDLHKVNLLLNSLSAIKQMGIDLIVYCPPMSDDFYSYAVTNKGFQQIFPTYLSLQNKLIKNKYHVIPFCTPKQIGLTDDYMLDGIHAGEVMVSRLFYNYIISNHIKFKSLPNWDLNYLKGIIDKKPLCPLAFDDK